MAKDNSEMGRACEPGSASALKVDKAIAAAEGSAVIMAGSEKSRALREALTRAMAVDLAT
jgi:hypothetical protein